MQIPIHKECKALIFDVDGTVADTMPIHFTSWQKAGEIHGFDFPETLFYELAGVPAEKLVPIIGERCGAKLNTEQVVEDKEAIFVSQLPKVQAVQPVLKTIEAYKDKLPMALGSGGGREVVIKTMEILGILDYFPIIVAAEDVTNHKPAPDTFLQCAQQMGVEPQFCQVFEDGDKGIEAAERAGMQVTDIRLFL